jgi:hypothetical protein
MYDYCERSGLLFAFGYATNNVLKQRVSELELVDNARLLWWMSPCHRNSLCYGHLSRPVV